MLEDIPIYETRDCSPMCNHQEECVRCHSPHCIKHMHHSRLYGYICNCGSQEWKSVWLERRLTPLALDLACAECGEVFEAHKYNNCGHEFRNPPSQ